MSSPHFRDGYAFVDSRTALAQTVVGWLAKLVAADAGPSYVQTHDRGPAPQKSALGIGGGLMAPETILGVIVAAVIVWAFVARFLSRRNAQPQSFKCSGCNRESPHDDRTREALRNNEARTLCQACYANLAESRLP